MSQTVQLLDQGRNVIATAVVEEQEGRFLGTVNADRLPVGLRGKFDQYEELGNGQVLGLIDSLEEEIAAIPVFVLFGDGRTAPVDDLQIFPQAKTISFRLAQRSTQLIGLTA